MATNRFNYRGSLLLGPDARPQTFKARFNAGATTAIKRGELLEFTGTGNTIWVPIDSDFDMSAALGSGGKVCVAQKENKSGDLAGYYEAWMPRPGDLFLFNLLSTDSQAPAYGTALYYNSSEQLSSTAGTNIVGHVAQDDHYPELQGNASDDASPDMGTTIKSVRGGLVLATIEESNSVYSAWQNS